MLRTLLPVLALASFQNFASAAELQFQFSGTLTSITDEHGFLNGQFSLGNAMSGILVYETNVNEGSTTLDDPTTAVYAAIKRFDVTVNGVTFEGDASTPPGILQVWDDRIVATSIVDALGFSSQLDYTPPIQGMGVGTVVSQANLNLFDFTHSASLNGTLIPTTIDISRYANQSLSIIQLNVDTNQAFHLVGSLNSVSAVPENSTAILFSLGSIFLLARNWRRAA